MSLSLLFRARTLSLLLLGVPLSLFSQSPVPGAANSPVSSQNSSAAPADTNQAQPTASSDEDETTLGKPLDFLNRRMAEKPLL